MAKITDRGMSLEIKFRPYGDEGWVWYEFYYWINGKPFFTPDLLKKKSIRWGKKAEYAFVVFDAYFPSKEITSKLLENIEKAASEDIDVLSWQPAYDADDVVVTIAKGFADRFQFLKPVLAIDEKPNYWNDFPDEEYEEWYQERYQDSRSLCISVGDFQFAGRNNKGSAPSISLILETNMDALKNFAKELRVEFEEYKIHEQAKINADKERYLRK